MVTRILSLIAIVLLLQAPNKTVCQTVNIPSPDTVLSSLSIPHPRLMLQKNDLEHIKLLQKKDMTLRKYIQDVMKKADDY